MRDEEHHDDHGEPIEFIEEPQWYTLKKGVGGLLRCAFRVRVLRWGSSEVRARARVCGACPHARRLLGVVYKCGLCGCLLRCALRVPEKACPDGRFTAVTLRGVRINEPRRR